MVDCGLPPVIWLDKTVSTNTELQRRADVEKLANESVLITGFQTAGRGQAGSLWESAAGENLTCSLLYYPEQLTADRSFVIAEMAALSVKRLLERYVEVVSVKWPNDVYWTDRKICGILVENNFSGDRLIRSIIGIGLNLNQVIFHSNAPNPVSLTQITGLQFEPKHMLTQLRIEFHQLIQLLESKSADIIHQIYVDALYRKHEFHLYRDNNGGFEACIRNVEPSGHLILERKDGTWSRYAFKEVACEP